MPEDKQKIGKIAADILEMARGKPLVNMRFLDLALSKLCNATEFRNHTGHCHRRKGVCIQSTAHFVGVPY